MNKIISALTLAAGVFASTFGSAVFSASPSANGFGKFEFALIGDTPYNSVANFQHVLEDINAHRAVRFVLHAGDIKTGSSLCSDELFTDRYTRFQNFEAPFILTPGDNEWTDCHRVNNGAYSPLERLAKLRQVFFKIPNQSLGRKPMTVESQGGEFVEHMRWTRQHVLFSTVHIVGSNNGLAPFDPNSSVQRSQADDDEVARRIKAAVNWIETTYSKARSEQAQGVLFLFQANPGFEFPIGHPERVGFEEVLAALVDGAKTFGKPVMLAHGDSHYFRIDKPVSDGAQVIPNLTRVETFGSANYHWLRVVVDPNSEEVFSVHQEIVEQ